jgi:hypothetical protein
MALLFMFVSPSIVAARIFVGTIVFLAILLLGLLAARISGRTTVGIIVAVSAMVTPWIFEASRVVIESFGFIFVTVLFLLFLHSASNRAKWRVTDSLLIAGTLALVTYSYAAGRLIAPIFAFGLLIFAVNKQGIWNVFRTWVIYAITLIPFVVVYFTESKAITHRFQRVTNLSSDRSLLENLGTVMSAMYEDMSLKFFVFDGDPLIYHHVPGIGEFLVGTFALGLFGIVIILTRRSITPWWRFVLFGAFVSMIPGFITMERMYAWRSQAFPIFFLLLSVPAITWLLSGPKPAAAESRDTPDKPSFAWPTKERYLRLGLLCSLLALTAVQAVSFQAIFQKQRDNPRRLYYFHSDFPPALDMAVEHPERPIYVEEAGGTPIYIFIQWYATEKGIDLSDFVHLLDKELPPDGAIVLSSSPRGVPPGSIAIKSHSGYVLYRYQEMDAE